MLKNCQLLKFSCSTSNLTIGLTSRSLNHRCYSKKATWNPPLASFIRPSSSKSTFQSNSASKRSTSKGCNPTSGVTSNKSIKELRTSKDGFVFKNYFLKVSSSKSETTSSSKDKLPPSSAPEASPASHPYIYTSKSTEQPSFPSFGGGFEHIDGKYREEVEADDPEWNSVLHNPRLIVKHLDEYVIGQERAKKVLSVAVFNHYNRVRANNRKQQRVRSSTSNDESSVDPAAARIKEATMSGPRVPLPVSTPSSFQYHQLKRSWINPSTSNTTNPSEPQDSNRSEAVSEPLEVNPPDTVFDKSNVLLLGPTGSGKTLLARTLANVLKVPFSMSDATPFTQAGYVGEDVELVIQRLLQNCDFDVKKAEQGIVFIDEIDKIARRPDTLSISKDVSGEGVQQALLRMLEGTNITITDKSGGGSGSGSRKGGSGSMNGSSLTGAAKGDTYTVNTSNILFILSGAFVGLDKIVMNRISRSSIGFDAPIRASPADPLTNSINYLDATEPVDLTKYGLIPEFIGRLPVVASVNMLDEEALVRVLTEPRNSLVKQYEGLFQLNRVNLQFTAPSLKAIAQENMLLDTMYEVPGTAVRYVVVTKDCISGKSKPIYLSKNQESELQQLIKDDEDEGGDTSLNSAGKQAATY